MSGDEENMRRIFLAFFAWIFCALTLAVPPALGASSLAYQSERITARLITAENAVTPTAGTLSAALEITLAKGWKTYWKAPGAVGYAPELDWSGSANLADATLLFPAPTRFEAFEIENYGYAKAVTFPIQVSLDEIGKSTVLSVSANVLVCAELCVPEMFALSVTLLPGEAVFDTDAAAKIAAAAEKVPGAVIDAGLSEPQFWIAPDASELQVAMRSDSPFGANVQAFPDMGPDASFGPPEVTRSTDAKSVVVRLPILTAPDPLPPLEITLRDGSRAAIFSADTPALAPLANEGSAGLWRIILLALLGGLILNVMPCVLPVLTVKFASALKARDQSPARIRTGFAVSALGVLTFMWALAAVLLAVRAAGGSVGWGVQFQNPVFLGVIITILVGFAANMAGFFEITLPQRLNTSMANMEDGPGLLSDFSTGALAAVLATPCSAPFLGTAVTFALAGSSLDTVAIFTALGVGLALPYLAVALRPTLVQALPKPGAWMEKVKWIMAGLLLATALWLGTVLLGVAGWSVMVLVSALLTGGVLILYAQRSKSIAVALAVAAISVPMVLRPAPPPLAVSSDWAVFEQAQIAEYVADGRLVFVDITASWCLTCKANKARVLDRDPVADALQSDDVVAMRGDWTRPDDTILSYLRDHGRFGIPFNIVYGPGAPGGIALPEFLTKDAVLSALEDARL